MITELLKRERLDGRIVTVFPPDYLVLQDTALHHRNEGVHDRILEIDCRHGIDNGPIIDESLHAPEYPDQYWYWEEGRFGLKTKRYDSWVPEFVTRSILEELA